MKVKKLIKEMKVKGVPMQNGGWRFIYPEVLTVDNRHEVELDTFVEDGIVWEIIKIYDLGLMEVDE